MYPSILQTEQHPKWNKTHLRVPDVEQKSPRQFFFYRGATALVGLGLLFVEDS
jgi:hypothetical protein